MAIFSSKDSRRQAPSALRLLSEQFRDVRVFLHFIFFPINVSHILIESMPGQNIASRF